jgi:hypothetical protein
MATKPEKKSSNFRLLRRLAKSLIRCHGNCMQFFAFFHTNEDEHDLAINSSNFKV